MGVLLCRLDGRIDKERLLASCAMVRRTVLSRPECAKSCLLLCNIFSRGRALATAAKTCSQLPRFLEVVKSKIPLGGPWVMTTSTLLLMLKS